MTVPTLLPIYNFAKRLGLHPLHFQGVDLPEGTAATRVCIAPIHQYSWQTADGVSREELSQSINDAEVQIATELGYWPAPKWVADERHDLIESPRDWYNSAWDICGDRISVKAQYGQMISGGAMGKTLIDDNVLVTYTDLDGDGYFETAEVVADLTGLGITDGQEVCLYYPGTDGDDEWQIRPVTVRLDTPSAGLTTITSKRELFVIQSVLESYNPPNAVPGLDDAYFLDEVDVYRKYNNPATQAQLLWRTGNVFAGWGNWFGCSYCASSSDSSGGCEACGLSIETGCLTTKDKGLGIVTLSQGNYDASTNTYGAGGGLWCRRPDSARLWYYSGWRDMSLGTPNITMAREWESAVAKLAISKLDRQICSCQAVADVQAHWNTDLRKSVGGQAKSTTYRITDYELDNNPFGTTVAALDVWRLVRRKQIGIPAGAGT